MTKKFSDLVFWVIVFLFIVVIGFAGCGGGGGGDGGGGNNNNNVAVTSVSLSETSRTLKIGDTDQLTATVVPANATNKSVTWFSDKQGIATVNSSGLVTAIAAGTATITVTTVDGGFKASDNITVVATDYVLYERWYAGKNEGIFSAEITDGILSNETELIPTREDDEGLYVPSYSPDKTKIAFVRQKGTIRDIAVLNIATGEVSIVLAGGYHYRPRWNSAGTQLVFIYKANVASLGDVAVINLDGTGFQNLTNTPDLDEEWADFNPVNDSEISYYNSTNSYWDNEDIFLLDTTTGKSVNITNSSESSEETPCWFPNGTEMSFGSDRNSYEESDKTIHVFWGVWLMNSDGSGAQILYEHSILSFGWPVVSRDGKRVLITPNVPAPSIWVVQVDEPGVAEEVTNSSGEAITGIVLTDVR
jgi:hypothetical protein